MGKLSQYRIDLKGLTEDITVLHYALDKGFFSGLEDADIEDGNVDVTLCIRRTSGAYELTFDMTGSVQVVCDRCLDVMMQPIEAHNLLKVKLGTEYADDGFLVEVPYEDGTVDVAWNMYETIVLAIPLQHAHPEGECREDMQEALSCLVTMADDETAASEDVDGLSDDEAPALEGDIDPRWAKLKEIINNKQ